MKTTETTLRYASHLVPALIILCSTLQAVAEEDWVARSNQYAAPALQTVARFGPEFAGQPGVEGVDKRSPFCAPGT